MSFKDLKDQEFHYLKVKERNHERKTAKWGGVYWICECKCGKITTASSAQLNSGDVKSCGCRRDEMRFKEKGRSGLNLLIRTYKRSAAERSLEYSLTEEQFCEITKKNCAYCNASPARISEMKGRPGKPEERKAHGRYIYNGIDRIDSTIGYIYDNCAPCCLRCNIAKSNMTLEEFKAWVRQVASFLLRLG